MELVEAWWTRKLSNGLREKYGSRKPGDESREGWSKSASLRRECEKEELDEK